MPVEEATLSMVREELEELSEEYGLPVPCWQVAQVGEPFPVSWFDHEKECIFFSPRHLSMNPRIVRRIVAHEFAHYMQFREGRLQQFPTLREFEAERFARDWVRGGERVLPLIDRPTPLRDILVIKGEEIVGEEEATTSSFCGTMSEGHLSEQVNKLNYVLDEESNLFYYKQYSQHLVWMSPVEFLRRVPLPTMWDDRSLDNLKKKMRRGVPLDPLFVDIDPPTGKVWGHEGRHRAKAALELGIEKVPVLEFCRSQKEGFLDKEKCGW